jgi:hypothetical protein
MTSESVPVLSTEEIERNRLAAALHKAYCVERRPMHSHPLHSADAILEAVAVAKPICGNDAWDSRYECVSADGHANPGPGLTSHDYWPKRGVSLTSEAHRG